MENIYDLAERAVAYYGEINKSNFTDSMDVIVIRHNNGILRSTPFYVRFGKRDVIKPKENKIRIEINDVLIDDILMTLDESGEAFFIEDTEDNKASFSNIASKICLTGKHLEESASVPLLNNNSSEKFDDYLKAANTLKEFIIQKSEDLTINENECESNAPKFFIDSSASFETLKYNNASSTYSVFSQDSSLDDSELTKIKDKVIKIEKSKFLKNINLTSEKLKLLNLKPGLNEIKYILKNKITKANIFLWESTEKIVISDIDGTITKSDLRGHIMSMIGRDWYQEGVVKLFRSIENNGYKIVYLSARPICQCELTRSLIKNLTQCSNLMPISAVLVNPVDFLIAFQSELIDKNPEEFKISCLYQLKSLFEENEEKVVDPFHAGFGNKSNDEFTYKSIGLCDKSIFIVDSSGKIAHNSLGDLTYSKIHENIDDFFPKIN
ncbi:unnamed protein product [Brachionus calyciflorus]|uniref:LNS2/PITP domain-containing protein n=1 Tax=Brachionus calyciflorus TaxID=104777 RepID=A0A814E0N4_9BILA|nr:unnamed protein product [Brachionus calyciflorus]